MRSPEKLWTERHLAIAMESLIYSYRLTGEPELLEGLKELFETAFRHITAPDTAGVQAITGSAFPPQNCLVHTSFQHEGGKLADPFCSAWMSALLVDPLLRYQELTGDARVDEFFVRLCRFLRDTGTTYFYGNPLNDSFMSPRIFFKPAPPHQDVRILIPMYGAGLWPDGRRYAQIEWDDFNHCSDVTAVTAAGIRALRRQAAFDKPFAGPFRTEGESFLALHHELSFCAETTFVYFSRTGRDPRHLTSSTLAAAAAQPDWLLKNNIGFPSYPSGPPRKLSWWFNSSLLQYGLLREAGVPMTELRPGAVQPGMSRKQEDRR